MDKGEDNENIFVTLAGGCQLESIKLPGADNLQLSAAFIELKFVFYLSPFLCISLALNLD